MWKHARLGVFLHCALRSPVAGLQRVHSGEHALFYASGTVPSSDSGAATGATMAKGNTCSQLTQAKKNKKDEFYTQIADIEEEVKHYRSHFKGKTVLCNCDDPRESMFFRYFSDNFEFLGLKKLIATCYKSQDVDLFTQKDCEKAVYQIYEGDKNKNRRVDPDEIAVKPLEGDGSFDSKECVELLKESDIVVTNPPFSKFREFIALLVKFDKKFLIIGNVNAITYKEVFALIVQNKMWLGASIHSGDREFMVPDDYPLEAASCRISEDGRKYIRVKGVRWFTNLDYKERYESIPLYKPYSTEENPMYDNYGAIEVCKTADIPCDYDGVMGVPITFMDRYNPEQFEILGMCENEDLYSLKTKVYSSSECKAAYQAKFGKPGTYDLNASGVLVANGLKEKVYQRILIRRRSSHIL